MRLAHSTLVIMFTLCTLGVAAAEGVKDKAQDAVDPNCSVSKAAKGAAMKATVGVGNRCDVAETTKDVAGVDGKGEDIKDKVSK